MSPPQGNSMRRSSSTSSNMAPMTSDYNNLNQSQSTVWKHVKPLFAKALQEVLSTNNTSSTFRIADLGCATGGNSVAPLSFVSSQLDMNCSLEVILADLPQNSWSSVVSTVTPETITANEQRDANNTFVYMVGRTFYESCAPAASLDMVYSLVAVHWMKSYAGDIPTGLYATDPLHNSDPDLLQAWRRAGQEDFADFIKARHSELKVGGRFIGAIACPKQNGDYPWSKVGKPIFDALLSKVTPPQALASCVLPVCWRTKQDVEAGFVNNGWDLEVCEFHETKDPVRESLQRGEITPAEYAAAVIESFKAVCHPTCAGALAKFMPPDKAEQLLNEAYNDSMDNIASNPEEFNLDVSFWYVLARKTGN